MSKIIPTASFVLTSTMRKQLFKGDCLYNTINGVCYVFDGSALIKCHIRWNTKKDFMHIMNGYSKIVLPSSFSLFDRLQWSHNIIISDNLSKYKVSDYKDKLLIKNCKPDCNEQSSDICKCNRVILRGLPNSTDNSRLLEYIYLHPISFEFKFMDKMDNIETPAYAITVSSRNNYNSWLKRVSVEK